ncbi:MAG: GNAT family N-acetyltransferase [Gammaproteobacteria bacterium PRO9]|nr:GNAT family N-acetyltransferase [Gammaproteobacteria bacterium PRO9]
MSHVPEPRVTIQPEPAVRRATPADADDVAALAAETFVETFGHLYRREDLQAFLREQQAPANYRHVLHDPAVAIWLATDEAGGLTGFVTAGPCKLPVPKRPAAAGEIRQLYLRGSAQGRGLGTRLLNLGLDWLVDRAFSPLYIGVWSGNHGAQRLYGRHGFRKIAEYDFPVGGHLDREFILQRG